MKAWTFALSLAWVSALLLWLAFFPVNAGWLGWVALSPLLALCRLHISPRQRYVAAWLGGLIFFVPALAWMRVGDDMMYLSWITLSIYCSIYWPLAILLIRQFDTVGVPIAFSAAIVWSALELARGRIMGGFAWYFLGHTQHDFLPLIQIADVGGVYAIGFAVAAVNGLLADAASQRQLRISLIALAIPAGILGYGYWRLSHDQFTDGPTVALLQSNIPQSIKDSGGEEAAVRTIQDFIAMQDRAAIEKPDLMVWPETSFPVEFSLPAAGLTLSDLPPRERAFAEVSAEDASRAAKRHGIANLLGINCGEYDRDGNRHGFNSALLVGKDGALMNRYDKIHRVPFGEFLPLADSLPFLEIFSPYKGMNYSIDAGTEHTHFALPMSNSTVHFGVLICYEDSDAPLARAYVAGPEPVDFLVNISNDGWFKGTAEHEQHLAISRFRAIECRRSLVRAVNMGVSAVIDSDGRVIALPGPTWSESKAMSGIVVAKVPIDNRASFYAWAGDWLPWTCWLIIAVVLLGRRWLRPTR